MAAIAARPARAFQVIRANTHARELLADAAAATSTRMAKAVRAIAGSPRRARRYQTARFFALAWRQSPLPPRARDARHGGAMRL